MTKKEFYLKSIIAMAGNANYVEVAPSEDDPSVTCHTMLIDEIEMDADRLLDRVGEAWPDVFDSDIDDPKESMKTFVGQIAEHTMDIRDILQEQSNQ